MRIPPALVALFLATVAPAFGATVEVRQPDRGQGMHFELTRAYAPCLAPNTVSRNGVPACAPAVTSACGLTGTVDLIQKSGFGPNVVVDFRTNATPACLAGPYFLDVAVRRTASDKEDDEHCTSGMCTFRDQVIRNTITPTTGTPAVFALFAIDIGRDASVEILGMTLVGPDGLPMLSSGVSTDALTYITNDLSLTYPACTTPDPNSSACSAGTPSAPCDFESGQVSWSLSSLDEEPTARVTLRDVDGTSPLCAKGTYLLEATVRETRMCGPTATAVTCTLVDQTVALPLAVKGRTLDAEVALDKDGPHRSTEIVASRLIDPTGATLATTGITDVRPLEKMRVGITGGKLRVQGTITVDDPAATLDPTLDEGVSVYVTDADGPIWDVTIPGQAWQLQPPLGQHWTYGDPGGIANGVRKVRLKRTGKVERGSHGYKLDLSAADADLSAADLPGITVRVVVHQSGSLPPLGFNGAQSHRICSVRGDKLRCK